MQCLAEFDSQMIGHCLTNHTITANDWSDKQINYPFFEPPRRPSKACVQHREKGGCVVDPGLPLSWHSTAVEKCPKVVSNIDLDIFELHNHTQPTQDFSSSCRQRKLTQTISWCTVSSYSCPNLEVEVCSVILRVGRFF